MRIGPPFFALFLVFLTLRLCNVIHWSWWWVTAPLWCIPAIVVLLVVVVAAAERWKGAPKP